VRGGSRAPDMTGQRFGRLVVLGRSARKSDNAKQALWDCRCDCGSVNMVLGKNLRTGYTRSCGCLRSEASAARCKKQNNAFSRGSFRCTDDPERLKLAFMRRADTEANTKRNLGGALRKNLRAPSLPPMPWDDKQP
jgi:hypothetical protein